MSDDLLEIQRLDITVDQLRHRRTSLAERRALEDAVSYTHLTLPTTPYV